jgi:MFS family permease
MARPVEVDRARTSAKRTRSLLLLAMLNAGASSSLYLSILPGIVRGLELTETQGGILVTAAALSFGATAPWWGRASDRTGYVRVIVIGLIGYGVSSAAFATAMLAGFSGVLTGGMLFAVLLVSRPLGGALAGAVPTAGQAYLAATSSTEERTAALAIVGIANGLGLVVGPVLGGGLAVVGLTAPLWVAAVLAAATALLLWRELPEPPRAPTPLSPPLSWRDARPRPVLLVILGLFTAIALVATTLGFLVQDRLGLDEQVASVRTGAVLAAVGVGMVASQVLFVLRLRPGPQILLRIGLPVTAAGIGLVLVAPTALVFVLAGSVMGIGAGLTVPGALAAASLRVDDADQGMLGGLIVACQVGGFVLGPVVGGVLYERQPLLPGSLAIALVLVGSTWALTPGPTRTTGS